MTAALRTTLATALVVLACGASMVTAAAGASAQRAAGGAECSPLDLEDAAAVREAAASVTDVFAGRVRDVGPRDTRGTDGGEPAGGDEPSDEPTRAADPRTTRWQHAVSVESPFRTNLQPGDRVLVVTLPSGRAGGLGKLDSGATYVFFVTRAQGADHLLAESCSGTTKVEGGLSAALRDQLDATLGEPAGGRTPDYTLSVPDDGERSAPSLGRLLAPGAAVVLLGVLGLLLLARIVAKRG